MKLEAIVLVDSINENNDRITTLQLCYPRFIHSEFMTHRVFSRNAMSSRAVPVTKMIEQVRNLPVVPWHWGKNQAGMQADKTLPEEAQALAYSVWMTAAQSAAHYAEMLAEAGLHKQITNRLLEPFQWMHSVVTATDWTNFFNLRCHDAAEPHMHDLANAMRHAISQSVPIEQELHLPYILPEEEFADRVQAMNVSAARCARVSYNKHDGTKPDRVADLGLATTLLDMQHASPFEHPAVARDGRWANYTGWQSYRNVLGL